MQDKAAEIFKILNQYAIEGKNVPVQVAAEVCGTGVEALRDAIIGGQCPFAFASIGGDKKRGWYVISPVHLWHWYSGEVIRGDR